MNKNIINCLNENIKNNKSVALVTIISSSGSSPRKTGSMMLVDSEKNVLAGSVGGGKIEEVAKNDAVKCINQKNSKKIFYKLTGENSLEMACGGETTVFINTFIESEQIIIVGGGHIAKELVYLLENFNYDVTIIDFREEYANKLRFPNIKTIFGEIHEVLNTLEFSDETSIVIITHGHLFDEVALEVVLNKKNRYIGMVGSKRKINQCFESLINKGFSKKLIDKVHSPIGLNIGGERPEEIALSILSEIQAVKYKKNGIELYKVEE